MDRRDFLKSIGLGGLALTLPKPLSIFAAKVQDLEAPPLHAGLARFRHLETFPIYDFGLQFLQPWSITLDRFADFVSVWRIHMTIRQDERMYMPVVEGAPVSKHLMPTPWTGGTEAFPRINGLIRASINVRHHDTVDLWLVPDKEPKFPLPPIKVLLFGPPKDTWRVSDHWVNGQPQGTRLVPDLQDHIWQDFRAVRLERTRAIELGLASPSDPFEAL